MVPHAGPRTQQLWFSLLGVCLTLAARIDPDYSTHAPEHRVQVAPVSCDTLEKDMDVLYTDNLLPDLAPWRETPLNMSHFDQHVERNNETDTTRVILIYNNTLYYPLEKDPRVCSHPCNRYLEQGQIAFDRWLPKMPFPNAVFYFNVWDYPRCPDKRACPVPFLSLAKVMNHKPIGRFKNTLPGHLDILVPKLPLIRHATTAAFPWEYKSNKAVWRGTRWCDHGLPQYWVGCSRFYLGEFYRNTSEARELIDFGYSGGSDDLKAPYMPPNDPARYRFIVNLDGYTAAYRLARTLMMNSAILKEESYRGEYYYRSLKEYQHYIPIFKDNATDILDVIRYWQQPENEPELKRIIQRGQEFATKYLCPQARMLYWRRVLTEFRHLMPDMDVAIENKWWPMVRNKLNALKR